MKVRLIPNMHLNSKKTPLLILGLTAFGYSRVFFSLLNDPEGPNLLIVVVLAVIVFVLSLPAYFLSSSMRALKRLLLVIATQIIMVTVLYFFLN